MKSTLERFNKYWTPEPYSGCWLWTGGVRREGYGAMTVHRKQTSAHRVSYELFVGPIHDDLHVLHKCDTPSCVNPDHLFLGTQKDNSRDASRKNRTTGENNAYSKLKNHQVLEIIQRRNNGESYHKIAKAFGVGHCAIINIVHGRTWAHVTRQTRSGSPAAVYQAI